MIFIVFLKIIVAGLVIEIDHWPSGTVPRKLGEFQNFRKIHTVFFENPHINMVNPVVNHNITIFWSNNTFSPRNCITTQ